MPSYGVAAEPEVMDTSMPLPLPAPRPTLEPRPPAGAAIGDPRGTLSGERIVVRYTPQDPAPALRGVTVHLAPGEQVAVMGPSGSGKTTLLHVLAGIVRPSEGAVWWAGQDLAQLPDGRRTTLRRTDFGFVFQSGHLLPELPAEENAALPLLVGGTPRGQALAAARRLFGPLGLAGLEGRRPGELSGGQAQRVAIARALVTNPAVVFADEPTGALDTHTGEAVLAELAGIAHSPDRCVLTVTHDPVVASRCDRALFMRDGYLVEELQRPSADEVARLLTHLGATGTRTAS